MKEVATARNEGKNLSRYVLEQEVKKILDNFSKALEKVRLDEKEEHFLLRREQQYRKENKRSAGDKHFENFFFMNLPKKHGRFSVAERAKWKK